MEQGQLYTALRKTHSVTTRKPDTPLVIWSKAFMSASSQLRDEETLALFQGNSLVIFYRIVVMMLSRFGTLTILLPFPL